MLGQELAPGPGGRAIPIVLARVCGDAVNPCASDLLRRQAMPSTSFLNHPEAGTHPVRDRGYLVRNPN